MKWHLLPAIDPADYKIPDDATEEQIQELLTQPLYRICNIYRVKDADGNDVAFAPNRAQCVVLHAIYIQGLNRLAVPKARQLGFSTLFAIICLDETHFSEGKQASIVDQTQADASEKLDKVRYAWKGLEPETQDVAITDNGTELEWANGSRVVGGKRARGGTNQVLHISEWGPIAYEDPARSTEIKTGAIPSVSGVTGKIFAESTHKGGKGGDWYDLIIESVAIKPEYRTARDFTVLFFPWWMEPRYRIEGNYAQLTKDTQKYFDGLEKELGVTFDLPQRLFYQVEAKRLKKEIYAEYPSTLEECWKAPTPGAIFAEDMDKALIQGRIHDNVAYYESLPVYTAFDLGAPENTICWIFQAVGDRINYLECLRGGEECRTPAAWVARLRERPYRYASHFLPHDGAVVWSASMEEAGLKNVVPLQRPLNVWDNINFTSDSLSRCHFHATACEYGINSMNAYHSKVESDGVTIRNVPVHDWSSHASTAIGYSHQAIRLGMLVDRSAMPSRPKRQHYGRPQNLTAVGASMGLAKPKRNTRGDDW